MATEIQTKKSAIVEELQKLGIENINPNASIATLEEKLKETKINIANLSAQEGPHGSNNTPVLEGTSNEPEKKLTDTDRILMAIGGLADRISKTESELSRIKDKGVNDFKMDMKEEDVEKASANKSNIDPKIVRIVEETLGVDFGIETESYADKPGAMLHILVPKRLSMVPMSYRPVRDPESGKYMVDPKTQQVIEEEYWPGDRRSLSMGIAASYEMVQQHCNRVRSFIISWYQKMNKPIPTFNLK